MQTLISKMLGIGLIISEPILDNQIHRIPTTEKPKSKNGWYAGVVLNDKIYCTFGNWMTGQKVKWNNNGTCEISVDDMLVLKMIQERVEKERKKKHDKAALQAVKLWNKAGDISEHEYLINKGIQPYIARQNKDILYIPIYNSSGNLVNLQRIYTDGKKKFLYGGEISGCASAIPGNDNKILICEGYATGSSIHEATEYKVIIAFNAGNLKKIAKLVRDKNPDKDIIICADNDKSGTGEKYGREAAELINAGFIMPDIVGFDFNDLHKESGLQAVKDAICPQPDFTCSIDDFSENDSIELNIPEFIYKVPGLISDGLQACFMAGSPDILQYNLPVVFSMISRAIASKLSINRNCPSLYNVKVGGTSTGKTDSDKVFKNAVARCGIEKFYGPTDFSSGPGLLRGMQETPQCYIAMDEVTNLFKRSVDDVVGAGKMATLMEIYTCAGDEIRKTYGDNAKSITIKNPCLVLTGNATPTIFDDIKMEDFLSGTLQRFDFWCYDGNIPYRNPIEYDNPAMDKFMSGITSLLSVIAPMKNKHDISSILMNYELNMTDEAAKLLLEYSKHIIDTANSKKGEDGVQGMISRKYNLCQKYLMIHIASTRIGQDIFKLVEIEDLQWGIDVAEMMVDWKINKLPGRVTAGDFHRDCEIFKEAIISAIRNKKKPTMKALCHRKKRLKELKPKDRQDIISNLLAQDEIIIDETSRVPAYWIKKDEKVK